MQSEEQKAARRVYKAAYYQAHKSEYLAYSRIHKEKWREHKREYDRSEQGKAVRTLRRRSLGVPKRKSTTEKERKAYLKAYWQTPKGKAYLKAYWQTPKGRAVRSVAQQKHRAKYKIGQEGFYTTAEWLALKEAYGNICLCCKKHESELTKPLHQDHVVPRSKGGSNWITNIQPLCKDCNGMGGKGTKIIDYRRDLYAAMDS